MPVYRRKFKTGAKWCVYVILPNGRRYRRVIGSKKQAEQVQRKLESEIVEGIWHLREKEDVPFSALVEDYLEYAEASKSATTYTSDRCRIEGHLLPYFRDISLKQITPKLVDDYKEMRVRQGASPKTVNNEMTNLSHMMKMAVRWGFTKHNTVSDVEKMKVPKRPPRFLRQDEIPRLVEAAKGSHVYPIIVTALHTGMRKSELLNLTWSDVDFGQRIITVQHKDDWHTKNYKSRTLQMTPVLYGVLREHRKLHLELGTRSEYVFTYRGRRIRNGVRQSLRKAVRKADLEDVTLHTLRHTFASQLVMAGVSLREVQELMGHSSFETTLQYAHLSEDHVKRQVLRLPFANG
jgi:integrase